MTLIEIKEDTAKQLRQFKLKHDLKSYDACITELLFFWRTMP